MVFVNAVFHFVIDDFELPDVQENILVVSNDVPGNVQFVCWCTASFCWCLLRMSQ